MTHMKECIAMSVLAATFLVQLLTLGGVNAAGLPCGAWHVVKSPDARSHNNYLYGVTALSANDAWAVGADEPGSGSFQTLTERWNGATWHQVSSPNAGTGDNDLYGVAAVSPTDLWAVGLTNISHTSPEQTLIEQWNGITWSVVKSPSPGQLSSLFDVAVASQSSVWAVGGDFNSVGVQQTLIEHWNGTTWSVVPSPNVGTSYNELEGVAVISPTNIWAVGGSSSDEGLTFQTLVEHWNGTRWSVVQSPSPGPAINALGAITAVSPSDIWAVGAVQQNNILFQTLVEHWNGTSWNVVQSPDVGANGNSLSAVAALSATDVRAVGSYVTSNHEFTRTLSEHWNGKKWRVVASPNPGAEFNQLRAMTVQAHSLWAVGNFASSSSQNNTLTEFFCE